jgi:hypothetical protein
MSYNPNSGWGSGLFHMITSQVPAFGNVFVVCDPDDTDEKNYQALQEICRADDTGLLRFYGANAADGTTPLEQAYAAAESNNNDVILLDANSTHILSAPIAWSKSRIHLIGMDGGGRQIQQGAKVQCATTGTTAYVILNTGVRNSFRNVKFIQSSTEATALSVLREGGEGNLYENCSFVFGVVDNLDLTTAHEVVSGSDSATYRRCTFGADTLLTSAARSVFHIDQVTASQEFKSNYMEDCLFSISSSSSTATFIRLDAVGDVLFSNLFKRCTFFASVDSAGGAALAEAVQTGTSTVKGCLAFDQCSAFNCTDFATATGGRNAAVQVVGIVPTAGTAGVGVQPTA